AVTHAGEVGHDGEAKLVLEQTADLRGALAGGAAGAVGDRDEVPLDLAQGDRGLTQRLHAGVVLGREKFQRTQRTVGGKQRGNGAVGIHIRINIFGFVDASKERSCGGGSCGGMAGESGRGLLDGRRSPWAGMPTVLYFSVNSAARSAGRLVWVN